MNRNAEIFGTIVALIVVGCLGYGLKQLSGEMGLAPFILICLAIAAGCYLVALWMDRRGAGR